MAPARAEAAALVLRPLLGAAPARLDAVVGAAGLQPVRDPTNADPRFARTELRRALADPAGTGLAVSALADAASAFGLRRTEATAPLASRLAAAARLHPEGHAAVDLRALGEDGLADAAAGGAVARRGGRAAAAIGRGGAKPPPARSARSPALGCGGAAPAGGSCASRGRWGRPFRPGPARSGTDGSGLTGPGARDCAIGALGKPPPGLKRAARGRAPDGARDFSRRLARRRAGGRAPTALS
jgi:tRNA(Ile)-lysidine synthase